jgi:hypothetical protein
MRMTPIAVLFMFAVGCAWQRNRLVVDRLDEIVGYSPRTQIANELAPVAPASSRVHLGAASRNP